MAEENAQVVKGLDGITDELQKGYAVTVKGHSEFKTALFENTKEVKKASKAANDDRDGHTSIFKGLLGHFGWAKKFQERAAKLAKTAASSVVKFGKDKLASVQKFAGNMLDLLLKGLGLAALWMLFKWLSTADIESTVKEVKEWVNKIRTEWENVTTVLDAIWVVMTRVGSGMWLFKSVINLIKGWFGFAGPIGTLWKFILGFGFKAMFMVGGAIMNTIKWIGSAFGLDGTIAKALKTIKESATFTKWFGPESKIQGVIKWIKGIFGTEGKIAKNLGVLKGSIAGKFASWFGPESKMGGVFKWLGTFFGSADEGGKIAKALQAIKGNKIIQGVGKFLGNIGGKMLKFFGPIGWLIAGYDAVMAFWDAFQAEEGSLWDKTVAGLSAGIQAIVDFFVFDLIQLAEDSIKWLIKKVMGLFGMDEKEIEGKEFMKFSVTGFLKEVFGDMMKIFEGVLKLDPALALEGLKALFGKSADIFGWLFDIAIKPAINWIGKNLFGMKDDAISDEFSLSKWIKESLLDPIFKFLENLVNFDMESIGRQLMGDTMYDMFFGEGGNKDTKDDLRKLGMMTDNTVFDDELKIEDISKLIASKEGAERQGMVGQLAKLLTDESIDAQQRDQLKNLLNTYGASLNKGGFIPAGKTIPAILHGPELIKPLPDMEKSDLMGGGGAPIIMNAPTTVNKGGGSTTMAVASSSINPMHNKYFRN